MEAFSEPCAWHAPPDLTCNAMPYPFLIQAPLPDLFPFYAATYFFYAVIYYLPGCQTHLPGSTIKQTHCILKCVFLHNIEGGLPWFYYKVRKCYFTSTPLPL